MFKQFDYIKFYVATANEFDRLGCGSVKAWFTGNRRMLKHMMGEEYTWAMFQEAEAVGTHERKYIMDIAARPYPQLIAGDIYGFNFDYAKRTLTMDVMPENAKGSSHIYISADRYYPDGFTVNVGSELTLAYNPRSRIGLEVRSNDGKIDPSNFVWNSAKQQVIILRFPNDGAMIKIVVSPGISR